MPASVRRRRPRVQMSLTGALPTSGSRLGSAVVLSRAPSAVPDRVTATDDDICTVGVTRQGGTSG